jgi:cytochrome c
VRSLLLLALVACGGAEHAEAPATAGRPPDVAPPAAVPEHLGLGRAPTAEEIAAWDIDVDPRGHGLPPGRGTVAEGAALYTSKACVACHGAQGEGGIGPQLVGRVPATGFDDDWRNHPRTIGNYWPYATTIYDYVHRAMPQTQPNSLTPDETYALTAYLLARNGIVGDDFVADATSLPAVQMPTKVEFVPDDREGTPAFR